MGFSSSAIGNLHANGVIKHLLRNEFVGIYWQFKNNLNNCGGQLAANLMKI